MLVSSSLYRIPANTNGFKSQFLKSNKPSSNPLTTHKLPNLKSKNGSIICQYPILKIKSSHWSLQVTKNPYFDHRITSTIRAFHTSACTMKKGTQAIRRERANVMPTFVPKAIEGTLFEIDKCAFCLQLKTIYLS